MERRSFTPDAFKRQRFHFDCRRFEIVNVLFAHMNDRALGMTRNPEAIIYQSLKAAFAVMPWFRNFPNHDSFLSSLLAQDIKVSRASIIIGL